MPQLDDADRIQIVVFGGFPGARYRSGRTIRILNRRFKNITDATLEYSVNQKIESDFTWFIRAGTIPRGLKNWHCPHIAPGGIPLCGFGIVSVINPAKTQRSNAVLNAALPQNSARLAHDCADWNRLQAESGGDFSHLEKFEDQLPRVASVLLATPSANEFAKRIEVGADFDTALRNELKTTRHRYVRLPQLDVFDDPALRVAEVVTSLQRGGAERIALDLTRELPRHGVRTLFFALGSPTRAAYESPDEITDLTPGPNRAEHLHSFANRAIALGCDAVHAHLLSASDMAIVAESKLPIVATIHNVKQGWPAGFSTPETPLAATLLVACSQAVERDLLAPKVTPPVRTCWNGIDAGSFAPSPENMRRGVETRARLNLAPSDFVLLSLANPRPQKRLERLPSVLAALQSEFKNRGIHRGAKLIIAGEASKTSDDAKRCESALHSEIERLDLADSVRIIGAAEDVAPLLWASDALVSVSAWEGLSLAHLEALAAGRHVVATDAGGTREIAPENPALTIVPLDASPELIASKLADIAEQKSPQLPPRSRSSFTLHSMAERYASLFTRAIELTRGPRRGEGIWLIANNFTTGGAQSSARRLLLGLKAQSIPVRAAVLQEREDNPTPGLSALRSAGAPVFIPEPRYADPLDAVTQILERIDADPPRAILFWNVIAEHKILLADALFDIPIFDVSPGEMFFDSLDAYFARPRPGLPYRCGADYGARLAGIVVKYKRESERAKTSLNLKPTVIPNGLPLSPLPQDERTETRFIIGTSARISPQKKLEELIAALRIAAPNLPPHVLKIAGRPESGGEPYAQSLKDLGTGLNIDWIGEFQDSKSFLVSLDLFAMISEPAGCPNASLEAMAAGLPVIATDHGGASEQVEEGITGHVVPRADVHALAAALIKLSRDPERCRAMGAAGRVRVEAFFSVERMVADYRKLAGI